MSMISAGAGELGQFQDDGQNKTEQWTDIWDACL